MSGEGVLLGVLPPTLSQADMSSVPMSETSKGSESVSENMPERSSGEKMAKSLSLGTCKELIGEELSWGIDSNSGDGDLTG